MTTGNTPLQTFRIEAPDRGDHEELRSVARRIFSDTFASRYQPGPFSEYLDQTYGTEGPMARDLKDPAIDWRIARAGDSIVGYAKLSLLVAPAPSPVPGALELRQIYVTRQWQGRGVAEALMLWAIERSQERNASELYLTVFDHNERAKRFYARHGFAEVGHCTFTLGGRVDDDRVWRRVL